MTLPRVVVRVTEREAGGWTVHVLAAATGEPVVPAYPMAAVEVTAGGVPQRVPARDRGDQDDQRDQGDLGDLGDRSDLGGLLDRVATRSTQRGDATAYGRWLFDCLLAPAWPAIRARPDVTRVRGVELALEWPTAATDLHRLVWEAMHDGSAPLAGHRDLLVAITRLVPVDVPPPATVARVPRVLFALGSALTDEVIRPGAMFMGMLRAFESDGVCAARVIQEVTADVLADECAAFQPDVVHLVAHGTVDGTGRGVLILGDRRPGGGAVGADTIGTALAAGGLPAAVMLSACSTGTTEGRDSGPPLAAELVGQGIPIVSAMAGEVSEQACRLYIRRLVQSLHAGEPVVAATAKGRRAALVRSEQPSETLDWAMPALFLAPSVDPAFRAINPAPTRLLVEMADELQLRQLPVFIGRREMLDLTSDFFTDDPARRLGFVGIVKEEELRGLGGTRLLREIGFALLRAGHVPLLLGPYSENGAPTDLRTVVVEILQRAAKVTELLKLPPVPPAVLAMEPGLPAAGRVSADALANLSYDEAHARVLVALRRFARQEPPLDPDLVRGPLRGDLARLAATVGAAGAPFGPHTRVVVLGDEAHAWVGALEPLLAMVTRNGLGSAEAPVPLVLTASLTRDSGPALRAFRDDRVGMPGFVFPELTTLEPLEGTLGFQWVLLNPWRRDAGEEYRKVYAAAREASPEQVHSSLLLLRGIPTEVRSQLYLIARLLEVNRQFVADDDERAYAEYVGRYG